MRTNIGCHLGTAILSPALKSLAEILNSGAKGLMVVTTVLYNLLTESHKIVPIMVCNYPFYSRYHTHFKCKAELTLSEISK